MVMHRGRACGLAKILQWKVETMQLELEEMGENKIVAMEKARMGMLDLVLLMLRQKRWFLY